jgi:hypothetical protein
VVYPGFPLVGKDVKKPMRVGDDTTIMEDSQVNDPSTGANMIIIVELVVLASLSEKDPVKEGGKEVTMQHIRTNVSTKKSLLADSLWFCRELVFRKCFDWSTPI